MHIDADMKMNTSDENFVDFVSEIEGRFNMAANEPIRKRLSLLVMVPVEKPAFT